MKLGYTCRGGGRGELDTLADVVAEVEMETTVCTLARKEVKELRYTLPRLRLRHCQRHGLTG